MVCLLHTKPEPETDALCLRVTQFIFQHSWPTVHDCECKQPEWVSSMGWLGWALERGWRAQTSEWSQVKIELLLLCIERPVEVVQVGCLSREVFLGCPSRRRPRSRLTTHWSDYISQLTGKLLGIPLEELVELTVERSVWASLLRLLPSQHGSRITVWKLNTKKKTLQKKTLEAAHVYFKGGLKKKHTVPWYLFIFWISETNL